VQSVVAAALNPRSSDAVAVRRFGGSCGDSRNTARLVDFGTDNGAAVSSAVGRLSPEGKPTLVSGIVPAIDDLTKLLALRASEVNRIVVVTSHGVVRRTRRKRSH
jgi:hypothetical protein